MKFTRSNILALLLIIISGIIIWFFSVVITTDYSTNIPKEKPCSPERNFNLYSNLITIDKSNLIETFPYKTYLDSANRCDLNSISNDVAALDSVNPNEKSLNREIISIALTKKLEERIKPTFDSYNPDSLINIVQWAEKFNHYQEFDKANAKLYRVIYKHWINFVSNKLRVYYDNVPKHKYDFKFQFLVSICQSKNLSPPIGNTDKEKIIYNLIIKDYSYLFSKFWYDTSFNYKTLGLIFILITAYGYFCIIKTHFKKS